VKSPHFFEFESLVQYLSDELCGSQLQEVMSCADGLVLSFYRFKVPYVDAPKAVWLVVDLDTQFPFLGLFDHNPWRGLKSAKPLGLFLNSNFKNHNLTNIQLVPNEGRVARFNFSTKADLFFDIQIIPKQPNMIAVSGRKKISWEKTKELVNAGHDDFVSSEMESRSVPYIFKQWLDRRSKVAHGDVKKLSQTSSPFEKWLKQRNKDIAKKKNAIDALDKQINNPLIFSYSEVGQYLKIYGFKNLPLELTSLVDFEKKVSWNIEKSFEKAKQLQSKAIGAAKRKQLLMTEITKLSDTSEFVFLQSLQNLAHTKSAQMQRKKTEAQVRKLVLDEARGIVCWMGKSAVENSKLLRESKAWDLWIHLKDYPSAYAILQKNKNQNIPDALLLKAAGWLAAESLKSKNKISGIKLAVVVVECRHVKALKGDKLGRVTYHYPREMLITV
jgi:hypothetical protein